MKKPTPEEIARIEQELIMPVKKKETEKFKFPEEMDPKKYIQVGINGLDGKPVSISLYELAGSNDLSYEDTHRFVLNQGLYISTPFIFLTHFKNIIQAKNRNKTLRYADNTIVPSEEIEEIYNHLTSNPDGGAYGARAGASTWLNTRITSKGLELVVGINNDKLFKKEIEMLPFMSGLCYINLDFNLQGIPNPFSFSGDHEYIAGKNIKYYSPEEGGVATFIIISDIATLRFSTDPANVGGAFVCCEDINEGIK